MTGGDPILLFGMPRSGTTWLGKLFDSHPYTLYRHEPDSVYRLNMPLFPNLEDGHNHRLELETFTASLPHMRLPKVVGKQPVFPKAYLSTLGLPAYRAGVLLAKAIGRRAPNRSVLFAPNAENFAQRRLVWKSIESVGRIGVCLSVLDNARAILILRHPCGYVASVQRGEETHRFTSRTPSSEDYGFYAQLLETEQARARGLEPDKFRALSPAERLAWRWVLTYEKALNDTEGCERVLVVRYEDVCVNPSRLVSQMFEFAGLDCNSQTAKFIDASTSTEEENYYSVFHDPVKAANRWRSELSAKAIDCIEAVLKSSRLSTLYEPKSFGQVGDTR